MQELHEVRDAAKALRRRLTLPEGLLWRAIKARKAAGLHFRKQHPIGPYVLDFYCHAARLCVEVDGQVHGFGDNPTRDERRDLWLADHAIRVLRLRAAYVLENLDGAVAMIVDAAGGSGAFGAEAPSVAFGDTSPRGGGT